MINGNEIETFNIFLKMVDCISFNVNAWAKAFIKDDPIKSAMVLFKSLFTDEEVHRCTKSGRKSSKPLDKAKCDAITSTLLTFKSATEMI